MIRYLTDVQGQELIRFVLEMPTYADDVAWSLKRSIDGLLIADKCLQKFLNWVHQKARSIEDVYPANHSYKPTAIRAFYFALTSNLHLALDLNLSRNLDPSLWHSLDSARNIGLAYAMTRAHTSAPDLNLDLDYVRTLYLARILDPILQHDLQFLTQQLPNPEKHRNRFEQWWKTNGQAWTSQFRTVVTKHCKTGYRWEFDKTQRALLWKYHNANNQLVNCLKHNSEISPAVRQEIEETLLLPIAEIEKRKKGKGKG